MRTSLSRVFRTAAALTALVALPLRAQIMNGSLTGPITNGNVPPGWTLLYGSPDTMDQNNNVGVVGLGGFGATPSASPDGGTWVGFARDPNTGFIEGFGQALTALTVGQMYTVSWYGSNFGYDQGFGYTNANAIEMLINGTSAGVAPTMALGTGWTTQSISFTASSANDLLSFQPGVAAKSYIGIDGISIAAVVTTPEPASLLLLATGLGVVALVMRRSRARS